MDESHSSHSRSSTTGAASVDAANVVDVIVDDGGAMPVVMNVLDYSFSLSIWICLAVVVDSIDENGNEAGNNPDIPLAI